MNGVKVRSHASWFQKLNGMQAVLCLIFLSCTSKPVHAQVLHLPISVNPRVEGTLEIQSAECYSAANIISIKIYNPTDLPFDGNVSLVAERPDRREISTRQVKLMSRREERVAFDFGKNVCKNFSDFKLISLPPR